MLVKVDQFCSLSTSPSWQAWLYHTDTVLYRKFIKRLQESKGCSQNRDLMIDILKELDKLPDGAEKLNNFLTKHYPHMIENSEKQFNDDILHSNFDNTVFEYYNPNLLTYPRRIIFTGDQRSLRQTIKEFVLDKIKYDSIIISNTAYIEYLIAEDSLIVDKIPDSNWRIPAYRLKNSD